MCEFERSRVSQLTIVQKARMTMKSVLKILIGKVCQECNVPSVIVNYRFVPEFKTKIQRLNQAPAKAKTKEGSALKKLFSQWTNSKYSTWSFKIYYNEMDNVRVQNENIELKGQKRKLEDDYKQERCKKSKLEKKLKEEKARNKEITGKF